MLIVMSNCAKILSNLRSKKKNESIENYSLKNNESIDELKDKVLEWNLKNPVDRWYREKYNIRFNSPDHRSVSFRDMLWEYLEDKMYSDALTLKPYKLNSGVTLNHQEKKSTKDEIADMRSELEKIRNGTK